MESATAQLVSPARPLLDEARLAVGGFLARYSGNTRTGYASDLRDGWPGAATSASSTAGSVMASRASAKRSWTWVEDSSAETWLRTQ